MPALEYFIVSRDVLVDRLTGDTSILGVLEDFAPREFPAIVPRISAISSWNCDAEDDGVAFEGVTIVHVPQSEDEIRVPFDGVGSAGSRLHFLASITNMRLEAAGDVIVEVQLNGQPEAHHRITILPADPNAHDRGEFFYPGIAD
jgi:hypothetical protein